MLIIATGGESSNFIILEVQTNALIRKYSDGAFVLMFALEILGIPTLNTTKLV